MQIYKDKLDLIKQSIDDVKYIKASYNKPTKRIELILSIWVVLNLIVPLINLMIHGYNVDFNLYQYSNLYFIHNKWSMIIYIFIPIFTYICICKYKMSVSERRFLKIWIIFPIILSLIQIMPIVSSFFDTPWTISNLPKTITFYDTFSLSLIIQLISMIYVYSYCHYKEIYILVVMNIIYIVFSYVYTVMFSTLSTISDLHIKILNVLNYCRNYYLIEILLTVFLIFILRRREKNDKVN